MADVTLELLQTSIQRCLDEQKILRREGADMRSLLLAVADQGRRTDRRLTEIRDDIELMVKAELMGRLGHFETQMESRFELFESRMESRLGAIEARLPPR